LSPDSVVNVVYVVEGSELIGASEGDDLAVVCVSGRLKARHVRGVIRGAGQEGVWFHADYLTYMGPDGGFQKGWNQVLADWRKQASLRLGGKVEPSGIVINVGRDIAVCHNWEKGQNKDQHGKIVVVPIRATNIFRREGDKWKMIGHHTDLLPLLAD
jgi:ketosteroid isomerase-like protein